VEDQDGERECALDDRHDVSAEAAASGLRADGRVAIARHGGADRDLGGLAVAVLGISIKGTVGDGKLSIF
jgi:hypothetical protein